MPPARPIRAPRLPSFAVRRLAGLCGWLLVAAAAAAGVRAWLG